ncbi:hypothetical protein SDC9_106258 [bioreactor metagenome]|uniref:DUF3021 domain-containing protein n=1 Tax=bioreactor metagenome TaxID=1076179 RepID=A0A645B2W1_9ZZZZ
MRFEELVKNMYRSFFMIATGVLTSAYIFCLLFRPDATFSTTDLGRILLMALCSDLPMVIFLSRKEPGKKQMLFRTMIHLVVLASILLYFAHLWNWVQISSVSEVAVFLSLILAVYIVVFLANQYRDKKLTDKINKELNKRYHS